MMMVLAIVVVLSITALAFHDEMAQRLRLARMGALDLEAQTLARGGMGLARAVLVKDTRGYTYFPTKADLEKLEAAALDKTIELADVEKVYQFLTENEETGFPFEGGKIAIHISDESARLNLNRATEAQLVAFFAQFGIKKRKRMDLVDDVEEDISREVALSTINWRSVEGLKVLGGATDQDYQSMTPPYVPRSGPFETIEELLMVRDFEEHHLFGSSATGASTATLSPWEAGRGGPPKAAPETKGTGPKSREGSGEGRNDSRGPMASYLTVFGDNRINVNTASPEVLRVQKGLLESPSREALIEALVSGRPYRGVHEVIQRVAPIDPTAAGQMGSWSRTASALFRIRVTVWRGRRKKVVETVVQKVGEKFRTLLYRQD